MRMGQGVRTGLGHGGITCVLQTQFSGFLLKNVRSFIQCFHKKWQCFAYNVFENVMSG